jgi:hypothetical protein
MIMCNWVSSLQHMNFFGCDICLCTRATEAFIACVDLVRYYIKEAFTMPTLLSNVAKCIAALRTGRFYQEMPDFN